VCAAVSDQANTTVLERSGSVGIDDYILVKSEKPSTKG
jgi:hypothetical protein